MKTYNRGIDGSNMERVMGMYESSLLIVSIFSVTQAHLSAKNEEGAESI